VVVLDVLVEPCHTASWFAHIDGCLVGLWLSIHLLTGSPQNCPAYEYLLEVGGDDMSISARNRRPADGEQTAETETVVNFLGMTEPVRPYLTPDEVERLATAARARGRHGHRDATMILLAYRHGLRVSELVTLRWGQIDLKIARIHIHRLKGSESRPHPLSGVEIRALRRAQDRSSS
jgi:integrase